MKILLRNIRIPAGSDVSPALEKAEKLLKASKAPYKRPSLRVYKKSIDARKKNEITFVCSVCAEIGDESFSPDRIPGAARLIEESPSVVYGKEKADYRPLVVGFGPAGMFCALMLAENGYSPVVIERGDDVFTRKKQVEIFNKTGKLDVSSNVQFGAGGAGTFSDGKLMTRVNDPLVSYVLQRLRGLGADENVLVDSRPHIGTDKLTEIVSNAEKRVLSLGGEIRYRTRFLSFDRIPGGYLVKTDKGDIASSCVVLATGHSSRDNYTYLAKAGFSMSPKPFSVGVRLEQSCEEITSSLYGRYADTLGPAEYNFSHREGEQAVYTFCMCPGGYVVASSSEEGGVVTNGMSESGRNGKNSNCALAVSVSSSDFGDGLFDGMYFQQRLERSAFIAGGGDYSAPVQTVGDYFENKITDGFTKVLPTYRGGEFVTPFDLNKLFSPRINGFLKKGLYEFDCKTKFFAPPYAVLTGVESRTSSPLRIERNAFTLESENYASVYPCGEGAGHAGGITSSAVDGIRVALKIMERFSPLSD